MAVTARSLLAAAAAAAVLAYGAAGHSLPQVSSHEGMAGSAIGLCLLLVTVVGLVALQRPTGGRGRFALSYCRPQARLLRRRRPTRGRGPHRARCSAF